MTEQVQLLDTAIEQAGGIMAFRRDLGVTHQAVYAWKKRGYVPLDPALAIEQRYGVPHLSLVSPVLRRRLVQSRAVDIL